ncbi:MAG: HPr kinase/phosphatase C-terminal domain-containing protein [Yoonia sp.]
MTQQTVHANCVALGDRGVLITGASGSGKSALSLELMAYGAALVSDDQVTLENRNGTLIATAPPSISGLIEARGFGILKAIALPQATVVLVVDMDQQATGRLPDLQVATFLECALPLHYPAKGLSLGPAIMQFLRGGSSQA